MRVLAPCRRRAGFTLLEVLVTVVILAVISGITVLAFNVVTQAWRRSLVLSDNLHHGDFVMDQLVQGLRSAYYPQASGTDETYGFWMKDKGDGEGVSDIISWVKLGPALVGADMMEIESVESPHRVEFFVDTDDTGAQAAAVRGWAILGQPEDFDPETVEARFLARRITGFGCRVQDPEADAAAEEIEWIDEWEHTNRLPYSVELTLWLEPPDEGDPPVELKRVVSLPLAPISWQRKTKARETTRRGTRKTEAPASKASTERHDA